MLMRSDVCVVSIRPWMRTGEKRVYVEIRVDPLSAAVWTEVLYRYWSWLALMLHALSFSKSVKTPGLSDKSLTLSYSTHVSFSSLELHLRLKVFFEHLLFYYWTFKGKIWRREGNKIRKCWVRFILSIWAAWQTLLSYGSGF